MDFFKNLFGGSLEEGFGYEYNLFCCEQAVLISETLKEKERIIEFHKSDWEKQKEMVPSLSEEHSGNTFQMSCRLAISYLPEMKTIIREDKIDEINS